MQDKQNDMASALRAALTRCVPLLEYWLETILDGFSIDGSCQCAADIPDKEDGAKADALDLERAIKAAHTALAYDVS